MERNGPGTEAEKCIDDLYASTYVHTRIHNSLDIARELQAQFDAGGDGAGLGLGGAGDDDEAATQALIRQLQAEDAAGLGGAMDVVAAPAGPASASSQGQGAQQPPPPPPSPSGASSFLVWVVGRLGGCVCTWYRETHGLLYSHNIAGGAALPPQKQPPAQPAPVTTAATTALRGAETYTVYHYNGLAAGASTGTVHTWPIDTHPYGC